MPIRPGKACRVTTCPSIVNDRKYQGYCEAHKDKAGWLLNEKNNGNRHQRGYGSQWEKLRLIILRRDKGLCQECIRKGIAKAGSHVDHIKPKAQGGTDYHSNLEVLCISHHQAKTATERQGGAGQIPTA
jgi:5-methylcytosine-specific restriction protein A